MGEEVSTEKKSLLSKGDDGLPDWMQFVITAGVFGLFFWILGLLFSPTVELDPQHRDLLNIILGAFITSFGKTIDFWFVPKNKDKGTNTGAK